MQLSAAITGFRIVAMRMKTIHLKKVLSTLITLNNYERRCLTSTNLNIHFWILLPNKLLK